MRIRTVLALSLCAACSFPTSSGSGDGGVIADGRTDAGPGDPDANPDAGPDAPPPQVRCGGPGVMIDDFSTGEIASRWGTVDSGRVSINNNALRLTLGSSGYRGIYATAGVDMQSRTARARLVEAPNSNSDAEAQFALYRDSDNSVTLLVKGGELFAIHRVAGSDTSAFVTPYNPTAHRWLQFRTEGNTLHYEVSPDNVTWTEVAARPLPPFMVSVTLSFGAVATNEGGSGQVVWDDINVGVTPETWCPAATFQDDFPGSAFSQAWRPLVRNGTSSGLCATEVNNRGSVTVGAGATNAFCDVGTWSAFSLIESSVDYEVLPTTSGAGGNWRPSVQVISPTGDGAIYLLWLPNLLCGGYYSSNAMEQSCVAYAGETHWRISADTTVVRVEAGDGTTMTQVFERPIAQLPAGMLDSVLIFFGGQVGPGPIPELRRMDVRRIN